MPSCARAGAEYVGQQEERGDAGGQRPAQICSRHRVDLAPFGRPLGAVSSWYRSRLPRMPVAIAAVISMTWSSQHAVTWQTGRCRLWGDG